MFGMGWPEMTVIAIVGVLVFGPDKLPDFARQAARLVRTVRRMAQDAKDDLGRELGHDLSGLDVRDLDPRQVVRRTIFEDFPRTTPKPEASTQPLTPPPALPATGEHPPLDPDAT